MARNSLARAARAALPRKRGRPPKQAEDAGRTRIRILEAAGKLIGKYGYAGCTIARVTAMTRIAHGAFYAYFPSRQDMFNALLPELGGRMVQAMGEAVRDATDLMEMERRSFVTNIQYLKKHPYMFRVSQEAESFVPGALADHMGQLVLGYVRLLRKPKFAAQLGPFSEAELRAVATMLIGARTYLLMRYGAQRKFAGEFPAEALDAYLKLVRSGLLRTAD